LEIDDTDIYGLIIVLLERRRIAVNFLVCLPVPSGFLLNLMVLVIFPILLRISLVFLNFFVELIILLFINLLP
jgi:hypothetical protein